MPKREGETEKEYWDRMVDLVVEEIMPEYKLQQLKALVASKRGVPDEDMAPEQQAFLRRYRKEQAEKKRQREELKRKWRYARGEGPPVGRDSG